MTNFIQNLKEENRKEEKELNLFGRLIAIYSLKPKNGNEQQELYEKRLKILEEIKSYQDLLIAKTVKKTLEWCAGEEMPITGWESVGQDGWLNGYNRKDKKNRQT